MGRGARPDQREPRRRTRVAGMSGGRWGVAGSPGDAPGALPDGGASCAAIEAGRVVDFADVAGIACAADTGGAASAGAAAASGFLVRRAYGRPGGGGDSGRSVIVRVWCPGIGWWTAWVSTKPRSRK